MQNVENTGRKRRKQAKFGAKRINYLKKKKVAKKNKEKIMN